MLSTIDSSYPLPVFGWGRQKSRFRLSVFASSAHHTIVCMLCEISFGFQNQYRSQIFQQNKSSGFTVRISNGLHILCVGAKGTHLRMLIPSQRRPDKKPQHPNHILRFEIGKLRGAKSSVCMWRGVAHHPCLPAKIHNIATF